MRKLPHKLTLIACLFAIPTMAQFSKGMYMPGLSIGTAFFNSGKTEYAPTSSNISGYTSNTRSGGFNFTPGIGWFVTNSLVAGGRLLAEYNYDKSSDEQNNVTFRRNVYKTFDTGLDLFVRKYILAQGNLIPFGQVNISGGTGSSKSNGFVYASGYKETYSGKSSGDFFAKAGLTLGVTKMLNEHAGIDLSAGYLYAHRKSTFKNNIQRDIGFDGTIDEEGVEETTTRKNNHGFSLSIGFQLFLGRRK